jgi:transposase-like protein
VARKGQKFKKVPIEDKLKIMKERLVEGKSQYFLARKYGISRKTIQSWERIYRRDGGLDIKKKGRPIKETNIDYKEKYEILKKYQEYLKEVDQERK